MKVVISVGHFITERQIRYISITLKISYLVIAINLSAKFLNKNAQNEKLAETRAAIPDRLIKYYAFCGYLN